MIYVNTDGLENISDLLSAASSKSDNEFYRIKDTATELQNNTQFQCYPQFIPTCEALFRASDEMNLLNEKLKKLDTLMKVIPREYLDKESKKKTMVENAIKTFDLISEGFSLANMSSDIIGVRVSDESKLSDEVQRIIGEDYIRMTITNIEPISKKVQEEYEIKTVIPIIPEAMIEDVSSNEG